MDNPPHSSSLRLFHPLIAEWFSSKFGEPSEIQKKAWPEIAVGRHVLAISPTGSGKTLAAFLWALDRLITGAWPRGQVRVLYISPLKALNNDVRVNLKRPIGELKAVFEDSGVQFPGIGVQTRSGDTPQNERRRMLNKPPEILITTPESLNILLSSKRGRLLFTGLAAVVLDEIHAVAGTKRGVHLITAVDRLVPLCGEFQRIALSATVRPKEAVAEFIGGFRMEGDLEEPVYRKRPVSIVQSDAPKKLSVEVSFPENAREHLEDDSWWPALARRFKEIIGKRQSTLFFANSRRLTEKVTRLINTGEPAPLAYSHHGSLSKELRLSVEKKLKNGELKAIVATNSLELGIDIGRLDLVALIQTPLSVSSALQRIGRSGHKVGEVSRGILFPTHGRDFLNSAVMAGCVEEGDIERIKPVRCPLDVLAQIVLSMAGVQEWDPNELFALIKTSAPYRDLSRRQFDLVLEMLAGRYADFRMRELQPRISIDRIDNRIKAKSGTLMLLYMAGGTIPDRGYYGMRMADSRAKIGELDEEFVRERRVGETFALASGTWKIVRITHNDVEVSRVRTAPGIIPFWRADARNRDFHFSEKIAVFLERADILLDRDPEAFETELRSKHRMDQTSAAELVSFLKRQKEATRAPLPHRRHILIEHFDDPLNRSDNKQVVIHTLWGGRINRPLAMAISGAWEKSFGHSLEIFADDDALLAMLPHQFGGAELLSLIHADNVESLLKNKLEKTGFFGARFRENAGRALLLPKASFTKRLPLWLNRLRSKKLLDAVMVAPDFPILAETWRTCLQDDFDLENLKMLLDELSEGGIRVGETVTKTVSPFADSLLWQRTNKYMYMDDTPESGKTSGISDDMFRMAAGADRLGSMISPELVKELNGKLQRTAPGYCPSDADDLLDWTKERLLIARPEWETLLAAIERDRSIPETKLGKELGPKIAGVRLPGASIDSICALETLPLISDALGIDAKQIVFIHAFEKETRAFEKPESPMDDLFESLQKNDETSKAQASDFLGQWLSYYGPVSFEFIGKVTGLSDSSVHETLERLERDNRVVRIRIGNEESGPKICDRENFEILLRMARKARRPVFEPLSLDKLPLFIASLQGLTSPGESGEDLQDRLEQLFGLCAPAHAWEEFIFPARLAPYYPAWLDSLFHSSDLCWFGCGEKKVGFAFPEDLELFKVDSDGKNGRESKTGSDMNTEIARLFPGSSGKYGFFEITEHAGLDSEKTALKLWDLAWRGKVGADTFEAVRSGILNNFKPAKTTGFAGTRRRYASSLRDGFDRWKSTRPLAGSWRIFDAPAQGSDEMEIAELKKDRVRQLFRRYGVLFRELLLRENAALQWRELFRTLRMMELSGEILSGVFFEGIPGLQFASRDAFRVLKRDLPEDSVYWMNATDPASLCGVGPEELKQKLPPRKVSCHLVFHGEKLVVVAAKNGKALHIQVPPDCPHLQRYFAFSKTLLGRSFNPRRFVMVETVNYVSAIDSPYKAALVEFGFVADYKGLELRPSFPI